MFALAFFVDRGRDMPLFQWLALSHHRKRSPSLDRGRLFVCADFFIYLFLNARMNTSRPSESNRVDIVTIAV